MEKDRRHDHRQLDGPWGNARDRCRLALRAFLALVVLAVVSERGVCCVLFMEKDVEVGMELPSRGLVDVTLEA